MKKPHDKNPLAPGLPDWCKAIVSMLEKGRALTPGDFKTIRVKWNIKAPQVRDFCTQFAKAMCVAAKEIERRQLEAELAYRESTLVEVQDAEVVDD